MITRMTRQRVGQMMGQAWQRPTADRRRKVPEVVLQRLARLLGQLAPAGLPLDADYARKTGLPLRVLKAAAAVLCKRGVAVMDGEAVRAKPAKVDEPRAFGGSVTVSF
jgi:hypothetical protein